MNTDEIMEFVKQRQLEKIEGLKRCLKRKEDKKRAHGKVVFSDAYFQQLETCIELELENMNNMQYLTEMCIKYIKK